MKLDKMILVNWGALRSEEYPAGNMTLLTGPTGSGKSTFLDALQTVMTAAHQNIFSYNPGQDETTQGARNGKTKRTLASYIVGAEDNLFARPDGAHGYVAAVFKPSEGETGKGLTALVAVAARVDGSGTRRQAVMERLALIIADDAALQLDDLMAVGADGAVEVVPVEKIEGSLKAKYRAVTNFRDAKREYLCQLYGRFRGQKTVSFAEAEMAAKAWSQSIAHKPIGSVDELVRNQILDYDPQQLSQRISQVGDLMRQVHGLRVEGERLKASISRLEGLATAADAATTAHQHAVQYQLLGSRRALQEDERRREAMLADIGQHQATISAEEARAAQMAADRRRLTESMVQLKARLSGIPEAEQKRRLEEELARAGEAAGGALKALRQAVEAAEVIRGRAKDIVGMRFPRRHQALESAAASVVAALSSRDIEAIGSARLKLETLAGEQNPGLPQVLEALQAFPGLEAPFGRLYEALAATENSFLAALHAQMERTSAEHEAAASREQVLAARKRNLAEGGADYPQHIRHALSQFRSNLPGASVQVLCDLVEPVPGSEWQRAIEGYMGGARFNFVVATEWEARAIDFTKERSLRANVIQGALCLKHAKPERVPEESIIHELRTEHPVAKAYLMDQYGGVVKVNGSEALRHTPRGLMKDGKASGARTMFLAETDDEMFGKAARQRQLERVIAEHKAAEDELAELKGLKQQLQAVLGLIGGLTRPSFAAVPELERAARGIEAAQADMSRLNLTEVSRVEAEYEALDAQMQALDAQIRSADTEAGRLRGKVEDLQKEVRRLDDARPARLERVEADTQRLKNLVVVNAALSYPELERQVEDLLATGTHSFSDIQGRIEKFKAEAERRYGDLREALAEYNQGARSDERFDDMQDISARDNDFAPVYGRLVRLMEKMREQLAVQRDIGLVKNLDELRRAEGSFKDVFTKDFCYGIRNAVDDGVKTLKTLNTELEKLKFGTDRFRIDWSHWVPEFKEYYDFFEAARDLAESQDSGDLFSATELSPENCRVRDRLVGLLLSDDQERAQKELSRIADYRNYRRYEIWKEADSGSKVALSEWGTGSGGQLETPAYIVRAAVVTNRLKYFDKGMSLRLLVNDESFSKMDERRAHDVIRFIRDSLGIQLICAMPTKHAGAIREEFTKEWSFTRTEAEANGEVDFISEADGRDLHPDKLRELWEARRQQVRLQAQTAFEAEEQSLA